MQNKTCQKCQYTWTTRKTNPKACPRCKARQDTPPPKNEETN